MFRAHSICPNAILMIMCSMQTQKPYAPRLGKLPFPTKKKKQKETIYLIVISFFKVSLVNNFVSLVSYLNELFRATNYFALIVYFCSFCSCVCGKCMREPFEFRELLVSELYVATVPAFIQLNNFISRAKVFRQLLCSTNCFISFVALFFGVPS